MVAAGHFTRLTINAASLNADLQKLLPPQLISLISAISIMPHPVFHTAFLCVLERFPLLIYPGEKASLPLESLATSTDGAWCDSKEVDNTNLLLVHDATALRTKLGENYQRRRRISSLTWSSVSRYPLPSEPSKMMPQGGEFRIRLITDCESSEDISSRSKFGPEHLIKQWRRSEKIEYRAP
jgi:hypothetical protein